MGAGLQRTGIAFQVSDLPAHRAGSSEGKLLALLMVSVALPGSVMSSTGVVAEMSLRAGDTLLVVGTRRAIRALGDQPGDFAKIGAPFTVVVLLICVLLVPVLFPLYP